MAALLLKAIEADVSGASHIFAPWKCPQTGQNTSSHVLEIRQKLMGSVSTPVEIGRPVIGHSNKIVPMSFSFPMKSRDRDAGMVNEWLRFRPTLTPRGNQRGPGLRFTGPSHSELLHSWRPAFVRERTNTSRVY